MDCSSFSFVIMFLLVLIFCTGTLVDGLKCYKCISLDCPIDNRDCKQIKSFLTDNLESFYYIDTTLPFCPLVEDKDDWKEMERGDSSCGGEKDAMCYIGRIKVTTQERNSFGNLSNVHVNYATIMGCAKVDLLIKIQSTYKDFSRCDVQVVRQNFGEKSLSAEIEHCPSNGWNCYYKDYCLGPETSVVKPWREDLQRQKHVELLWILGTLFGVGVIFSIIIGIGIKKATNSGGNTDSSIPIEFPRSNLNERDTDTFPQTIAISAYSSNMARFWVDMDMTTAGANGDATSSSGLSSSNLSKLSIPFFSTTATAVRTMTENALDVQRSTHSEAGVWTLE